MPSIKAFFLNLWRLRFVIAMMLSIWLAATLFTEISHAYPRYVQGTIAVFVLCVVGARWRTKRQDQKRGWRVKYVSQSGWAYQELRDGVWEGIAFTELGDHRESPHILDGGSPTKWASYPSWLNSRRDEIIARVRTQLQTPTFVIKENA